MVISEQNKGSYFLLKVKVPNIGYMNDQILIKIENQLDLILASITATSNIYRFENNQHIIYLFSTKNRKRKGQLNKLIEEKLIKNKLIDEYKVVGLLKKEFKQYIDNLKAKDSLKLSSEPINFEGYEGKDLKIFENKENWFKWQLEVYGMLFSKTGIVKEPDSRTIISIYDPEGASGKSTFFKHLYFTNPDKVARISYASAQQLRSSLVNLSAHQIYIIDLVRTKGRNDSYIDLISVLEDLKNGLVFNGMYGSGNNLLMEPPHIILSANFIPDIELLSKDRWKIYQIKNEKLIDITNKEKAKQKRKIATKKLEK